VGTIAAIATPEIWAFLVVVSWGTFNPTAKAGARSTVATCTSPLLTSGQIEKDSWFNAVRIAADNAVNLAKGARAALVDGNRDKKLTESLLMLFKDEGMIQQVGSKSRREATHHENE